MSSQPNNAPSPSPESVNRIPTDNREQMCSSLKGKLREDSDYRDLAEQALAYKDPEPKAFGELDISDIRHSFILDARSARSERLATSPVYIAESRKLIEGELQRNKNLLRDAQALQADSLEDQTSATKRLNAIRSQAVGPELYAMTHIPLPEAGSIIYIATHRNHVDKALDEKLNQRPRIEQLTRALVPGLRTKGDFDPVFQALGVKNIHPGIRQEVKRIEKFAGAYLMDIALNKPDTLVGIIEALKEKGTLPADVDSAKKAQLIINTAIDIAKGPADGTAAAISAKAILGKAAERVSSHEGEILRLTAAVQTYQRLLDTFPTAGQARMTSLFEQASYLYSLSTGKFLTKIEELPSFLRGVAETQTQLSADTDYSFDAIQKAIARKTQLAAANTVNSTLLVARCIDTIDKSMLTQEDVLLGPITGNYVQDGTNASVIAYRQFTADMRNRKPNTQTLTFFGKQFANLLDHNVTNMEYINDSTAAKRALQMNQQIWILRTDGTFGTIAEDMYRTGQKLEPEDLLPGTKYLRITISK